MKIEKAIGWGKVSIQLQAQMNQAGYNPDLNKMLRNIDLMVTELSKLEVGFRRIHKSNMTDDSSAVGQMPDLAQGQEAGAMPGMQQPGAPNAPIG
jgi:hypothetical protein